MDTFIGTLVFLLPGLMLYFWLQSFGLEPVVKHSTTEFTAISVLLWFPVSISSIFIYDFIIEHYSLFHYSSPIWSTEELNSASSNFSFLIFFLLASAIISFLYGVIWSKFIHKFIFLFFINIIRKWRGVAALSNNTTVWAEVFLENKEQIVEIYKLDNDKQKVIGEIKNTSRVFETEKNIVLQHVDHWTKIISDYQDSIEVDKIFIDTKTGYLVKIFNKEDLIKAQNEYNAKQITS